MDCGHLSGKRQTCTESKWKLTIFFIDRRYPSNCCLAPITYSANRFIAFNVAVDHHQASAPVVLVACAHPWTRALARLDRARAGDANGCSGERRGKARLAMGRRMGTRLAYQNPHSLALADAIARGEPARTKRARGREARHRRPRVINPDAVAVLFFVVHTHTSHRHLLTTCYDPTLTTHATASRSIDCYHFHCNVPMFRGFDGFADIHIYHIHTFCLHDINRIRIQRSCNVCRGNESDEWDARRAAGWDRGWTRAPL